MIIFAVLSQFDFVAKFTVKNLNKDFTNTGRGEGGHHFMKVFHKTVLFFKGWLPLSNQSFSEFASMVCLDPYTLHCIEAGYSELGAAWSMCTFNVGFLRGESVGKVS